MTSTKRFLHKNASKNVVYKNGAILSRGNELKIYIFRLTHPFDIILFRHLPLRYYFWNLVWTYRIKPASVMIMVCPLFSSTPFFQIETDLSFVGSLGHYEQAAVMLLSQFSVQCKEHRLVFGEHNSSMGRNNCRYLFNLWIVNILPYTTYVYYNHLYEKVVMMTVSSPQRRSSWRLLEAPEVLHGDVLHDLKTFSSVIIITIKFDLRLSIDSAYEPIIIHSFIYYVNVCLFRHLFRQSKIVPKCVCFVIRSILVSCFVQFPCWYFLSL